MAAAARLWPPRLEELPELPPPHEILELEPCKPFKLTVIRYELGKMVIKPRWPGAPPEKVVAALRVHVPEEEKKLFPYYYDLTPSTLVPQVLTILAAYPIPPRKAVLEIHKVGVAPKARFSVKLVEVI